MGMENCRYTTAIGVTGKKGQIIHTKFIVVSSYIAVIVEKGGNFKPLYH